jgi:hypothetical protein
MGDISEPFLAVFGRSGLFKIEKIGYSFLASGAAPIERRTQSRADHRALGLAIQSTAIVVGQMGATHACWLAIW